MQMIYNRPRTRRARKVIYGYNGSAANVSQIQAHKTRNAELRSCQVDKALPKTVERPGKDCDAQEDYTQMGRECQYHNKTFAVVKHSHENMSRPGIARIRAARGFSLIL